MPINIDGKTDIQQYFYQSLTQTSNSLGLSQLWLVGIDKRHMEEIDALNAEYLNKYDSTKWNVQFDSPETIHTRWFIGDTYYVLAQNAVFPGDGLTISRSGVNQTGALKGLVSEQRNDLTNISISFLETNQSIADLFFRPWIINLGFKSLKYQPLRKPIKLVCFQKDGITEPLKIRKTIVLDAAAPISVDDEEFNYTGDKVILRQVKFVFNRYHIESIAGVDKDPGKYAYENLAYMIEGKSNNFKKQPADKPFKPAEYQPVDSDPAAAGNLYKLYAQNAKGTMADPYKKDLVEFRSSLSSILRGLGLDGAADFNDAVFSRVDTITAPIKSIKHTLNEFSNAAKEGGGLFGG